MNDPTKFLERISAYTAQQNEFTPEFSAWLANLVDSLNSTIEQIEKRIESL